VATKRHWELPSFNHHPNLLFFDDDLLSYKSVSSPFDYYYDLLLFYYIILFFSLSNPATTTNQSAKEGKRMRPNFLLHLFCFCNNIWCLFPHSCLIVFLQLNNPFLILLKRKITETSYN